MREWRALLTCRGHMSTAHDGDMSSSMPQDIGFRTREDRETCRAMSSTVEQTHATNCEPTDSGPDQSSLAVSLEGDGLSTDAKLAINKLLKQRRSSRQKGSIERRSPLRLKPRARTQLDLQEEHLAALLKAKEGASRLPKQSAYAKHRLACIEKAFSLLDMQR